MGALYRHIFNTIWLQNNINLASTEPSLKKAERIVHLGHQDKMRSVLFQRRI